jgi:hypothetical protein
MGLRPGICVAWLFVLGALCWPALAAADSLTVFADNSEVALGNATTVATHVETSPEYGGGHVALKYKGADAECAASPDADEGADAVPPGQPLTVAAGQGAADLGDQIVLDVGVWRVCVWLVDDASGAVTTQGSTVVRVLPYSGALSIRVDRQARRFQITLNYATSAPGRLYAWLQPAGRSCARNPTRMPKGSLLLVPKSGRFVGSDGGLGRAVDRTLLSAGRWRVCAWLRADVGAVGPATRTFAVPRRARRGGRAAG